jgi:hypothetical protein
LGLQRETHLYQATILRWCIQENSIFALSAKAKSSRCWLVQGINQAHEWSVYPMIRAPANRQAHRGHRVCSIELDLPVQYIRLYPDASCYSPKDKDLISSAPIPSTIRSPFFVRTNQCTANYLTLT